jgi:hypothetical protein
MLLRGKICHESGSPRNNIGEATTERRSGTAYTLLYDVYFSLSSATGFK